MTCRRKSATELCSAIKRFGEVANLTLSDTPADGPAIRAAYRVSFVAARGLVQRFLGQHHVPRDQSGAARRHQHPQPSPVSAKPGVGDAHRQLRR